MIQDVSNLSSAEIRNLSDEKEKELQKANEFLSTVTGERLRVQRQIIELQLRKKDLEISEEKAKYNVKALGSDIRILTNSFWSAKNGGL